MSYLLESFEEFSGFLHLQEALMNSSLPYTELAPRRFGKKAFALHALLWEAGRDKIPVESIIFHCDGAETVVPVSPNNYETVLLLFAFLICSGSSSTSFRLTDDMREKAIHYLGLEHHVATRWPGNDRTMKRPLRSRLVMVTLKLTASLTDYSVPAYRNFLVQEIERQLAHS